MNKTFLRERMHIYHMTTGLPISIYTANGKLIDQTGMPTFPFSFLGVFPIESIVEKKIKVYYNHLTDYKEYFIALNVTNTMKNHFTVVVGPFKYSMLPINQIQKISEKAQLKNDETTSLQMYYNNLPTAKMRSIYQQYKYIEFLFQSNYIVFQNPQKELIDIQLTEKNRIEYREIDFYHHSYLWEKRIDSLFKDRIYPFHDHEISTIEPAIISTDTNRNQKILFIISISVFERYAIEHGLDPNISYTITDTYLRRIEEIKNLSHFDRLMEEVVMKYRKALELVNQSKYSKIINETIGYIHRNLLMKCTLTKASSHVNVHPDYLSKLFIKELGMSFTDYILKEKLEEAKILLQYSNKSLSEISKILNFSSNSYFIKCFKKLESITPGEYINQRNISKKVFMYQTSYKENMYMYHMTTGLPISIYTLDGVLIHQIGMPMFPFEFLGVFPKNLISHKKPGSFYDNQIQCENKFSHCGCDFVLASKHSHVTNYEEHIIALQVTSSQSEGFTIVVGPYKYKMPTIDQIKLICEKAGIGKFKTIAIQKYYYSLPTAKMTSTDQHYEYLRLLFEGTSIISDDIGKEFIDNQLMEKNMIEYGVIDFNHHNYMMEKRNIDLLFKGRIHPFNDNELSNIELGTISNGYMSNTKNLSIVNMSLFGRYAIEHGLDTHMSFTINDAYLRMIEASKNLSDIDILMQDAYRKYHRALAMVNQSKYSKTINEAIRYINRHLSQKFTLEDVASHVKIHPNYLSELIKKELGMSFTDYVLKEKIEEAKILLQYSNNTLSDISGILNFSSKSYFIKCFKKIEGITPGHYIQQKNL